QLGEDQSAEVTNGTDSAGDGQSLPGIAVRGEAGVFGAHCGERGGALDPYRVGLHARLLQRRDLAAPHALLFGKPLYRSDRSEQLFGLRNCRLRERHATVALESYGVVRSARLNRIFPGQEALCDTG